ncbi:MAG: co-chaperone GroES [Desulfovibrionaceae bacterium]|nr:co-chaperone GroES [Desulfovibrionaceae bacterium]
MGLKPLHDRVIVKRIEDRGRTASGLYIPDTARERPMRGLVLAAGRRRDGKALGVKPGDEVVFAVYAGTDFRLDGEDHVVLAEDEILALVQS